MRTKRGPHIELKIAPSQSQPLIATAIIPWKDAVSHKYYDLDLCLIRMSQVSMANTHLRKILIFPPITVLIELSGMGEMS
jgi:hypothetical protein